MAKQLSKKLSLILKSKHYNLTAKLLHLIVPIYHYIALFTVIAFVSYDIFDYKAFTFNNLRCFLGRIANSLLENFKV